jgi:hypothetical protein
MCLEVRSFNSQTPVSPLIMEDHGLIAKHMSEAGMPADIASLELVKRITMYGKTGFKDREIMSLSADLTNLAGKTAKHVSKNLMKQYSQTITSLTGVAGNALGAAGAVLVVATMIFNLVSELQDRAETNEIAKRHLQGIDEADGLAPESIRIVAAVKQIVERGFDQHELRLIDAESSVTVDFLSNTIIPLVQDLESMDDQTVATYHRRLVERIDITRRNMHVHLQRFSTSLGAIEHRGDYQIDTNHLTRYSSACILDATLTFYGLLMSIRLRDGLVQHNFESFVTRNRNAVTVLQQSLDSYTNGRITLIRTEYRYE